MDNSESSRPDTIPAPPRETVRFVGDVGPLFEALAEAQGEFETVVADSVAKVEGKDGKRGYDFAYAGLDVVLAAVRPALSKHGLAILQVFSGLGEELTTVLALGGARVEVTCGLPEWKGAQGLGSAVTYMKRYQLLGLLGVAPSDDDDGNAADGHQASFQQKPKQTPPQPKPAPPANPNGPAEATKDRIRTLSKQIGFKGAELDDFSVKHGCGPLTELNQAKADALVKMLESQANPVVPS